MDRSHTWWDTESFGKQKGGFAHLNVRQNYNFFLYLKTEREERILQILLLTFKYKKNRRCNFGFFIV